MKEAEEAWPRAHQGAPKSTPSRARARWAKVGLAVFVAGVALGAVGLFGRRVLVDAVRPEHARTASPDVERDGRWANREPLASPPARWEPGATSPVPALEPDAGVPRPIAPDLPRPETAEALIEEAERTVDRLLRSFPDDPDALEVKARILFYVGSYSEAVESWERCLACDSRYAYAYHGLGLVAAKKADYEEAAAQQRRALALAPGFSDAAVELADALVKLDRPEEAIEVLEKHLAVSSRSLPARVALGQAYLQARDYGNARDAYRTALEMHGELPRAQFGLATALTRLGRRDESRRAMERYRELEARKIERRRDLRSRFDDLEAMCADFAVRFTYAGRVCLAHGDLAQTEQLWRRAATLDPAGVPCRVQLASLYEQTDRPEAALGVCRELAEIEPASPAHRLHLGLASARLRRFDQAEAAFREVIRLAPQSPEGHAALAGLYLSTGRRLDDAARLAQTALDLQPNAPNYALWSQVCAARGARAEAISAIERAIELDSANAQYREMLELLQEEVAER